MSYLYVRTMEKKQFIEAQGYTYECKWECDFKRELEKDPDMKQYIQSLGIVTPLEPREEAYDNKQIKYCNVTSLYPWLNKMGKIPLGHPTVITENFKDISC